MVFFFNDTATTEIYTLSLHDALPILEVMYELPSRTDVRRCIISRETIKQGKAPLLVTRSDRRSEEHTSELQSRQYLVCRLLLEKKNIIHRYIKCIRYMYFFLKNLIDH